MKCFVKLIAGSNFLSLKSVETLLSYILINQKLVVFSAQRMRIEFKSPKSVCVKMGRDLVFGCVSVFFKFFKLKADASYESCFNVLIIIYIKKTSFSFFLNLSPDFLIKASE